MPVTAIGGRLGWKVMEFLLCEDCRRLAESGVPYPGGNYRGEDRVHLFDPSGEALCGRRPAASKPPHRRGARSGPDPQAGPPAG